MTLRGKLQQIDAALNGHNFSDCFMLVQEYREMVAQCVQNEYPSPKHITDAEQMEVHHDLPEM